MSKYDERCLCIFSYNFDPYSIDDLRRITEMVRDPWTKGGPIMKRIEDKYVGDYSTHIRIYYPNDNQTSSVHRESIHLTLD